MEREFTAVFEKRGRWYVAYVEEVPGVNTPELWPKRGATCGKPSG